MLLVQFQEEKMGVWRPKTQFINNRSDEAFIDQTSAEQFHIGWWVFSSQPRPGRKNGQRVAVYLRLTVPSNRVRTKAEPVPKAMRNLAQIFQNEIRHFAQNKRWWNKLVRKQKLMSIIERLFSKQKIQVRQRPFVIEESKTKEERSQSCPTDDRYCRICFDDKKKEMPIKACKCKGTIGLVHMSCLEKWLAMSNTHTCELCGYNYQTIRTPRYKVLYSIYYWVFLDRNPQYHRGLKSDFIVFVVLTPIAFVGVYSCIVAADFYSKEPHKYSPASRWTTISLLIMVVLLTFAYYLWVAVTIRFHMRIWYIWWQANNIVKVIPRDPAETVPSSESTGSRTTEAAASAPSCGASNAETQIAINDYTV